MNQSSCPSNMAFSSPGELLAQLELQDDVMTRFKLLYKHLNAQTVSREVLASCYGDAIVFLDPVHQVNGLDALTMYFEGMYENAARVDFDFGQMWQTEDKVFIRWQMHLEHSKLNSGNAVTVDGGSELLLNGNRIVCHQDIFDMGQMLYEHIPVLSWAIKKIKQRLAS